MGVILNERLQPQNEKQAVFLFPPDSYSQGYRDGYQTGIEWDASWWPGGPWAWNADNRHSEELQRKALASQENRKDWLEGFKRGLEERLKVNAHFAAWWNNISKPRLSRYIVTEQ